MKKVAVITGGSRGIGADTVRLFSEKGYQVAFMYEKSDKAAELLSMETGAFAIKSDVGDKIQIEKAIEEVRIRYGAIDTVVCNAGISQFKLFTDITENDWNTMIRVNLSGAFYTAQAAVTDMIHAKRGNIIFVSSIWGITGASCEVHYSTSKSALIGLTKSLAKELGMSGIRVNCVAPGVVDTDMNAEIDEKTKEELCAETPLGKIGITREISEVIYFLASEKSSFITGQIISPNGGMVI